jgi:predicted anti-sigma-YlaC factor YlaD
MTDHHDMQDAELKRLLGPAGPEIGCDACFDLLDEFVELELAGIDADARIPGLRAHLAGCPACREEHDALCELAAGQAESE